MKKIVLQSRVNKYKQNLWFVALIETSTFFSRSIRSISLNPWQKFFTNHPRQRVKTCGEKNFEPFLLFYFWGFDPKTRGQLTRRCWLAKCELTKHDGWFYAACCCCCSAWWKNPRGGSPSLVLTLGLACCYPPPRKSLFSCDSLKGWNEKVAVNSFGHLKWCIVDLIYIWNFWAVMNMKQKRGNMFQCASYWNRSMPIFFCMPKKVRKEHL